MSEAGTAANYNQKLIEANLVMLTKKVNMELERGMEQDELTPEEEKILALRDSEEFLKEIVGCNDVASVREAFKKQEVELSEDEAKEFIENVQITSNKVMNATEELSDDELAEIAGGSWSSFWKKAKKYVIGAAVSAVAGAIAAVVIGATFGGGVGLAAVGLAALKGAGGGLLGAGLSDLWNAGIGGKIGVGVGAAATVAAATAFVL